MQWGLEAADVHSVTAWAVALVAAATCAVWAERATHPAPFHRREAQALAGWAGVSAAAHLVRLAPTATGHSGATGSGSAALGALGWLLSVAAMALAIGGVAAATRRVVLAGRLTPVVAESALIGVGVVTVLWGITGAGRAGVAVLRPLSTAVVATTLLALVLRARAVSPSLVVDGRFRGALGWGAVGAAAMAIAGWGGVLGNMAGAAGASLAALVGYLAVAAAALAGPRPPHPPRRARLAERLAPLVVAAVAVLALVLRVVLTGVSGVGTAGAVLGSLLLACLLAIQVLTSRENDQLTADLEYSRARLAAMAENSADVIIGLDRAGRMVAANDAAARLLGRTPASLVGSDIAVLADEEARVRVRAAVLDVVQGLRDAARVELVLAAPATGTAELRLRGVPGGAVANLSDVTESVELRERLVSMARFDEMTGLANRPHLVEELGRWLSGGHPVAVLYFDLDGFKAINDRFGHAAGDGALAEVARRLTDSAERIPGTTMVGRLGGDEFVIALLDASGDDAVRAAAQVLTAMRPTFAVADRAVRIGTSIGVASTEDDDPGGEHSTGAAALLHRADIAMFAAKGAGRAQVVRWDVELEERARRKVDIAIGLRRALETGRLALAYQPIVRLADGVIVSVEALIRLPGVDGDREGAEPGSLAKLADLVAPAELVEVAEGTGEIDELGRWVLTEATHQAARWQQLGHSVRVSVNMSVRQLSDPDFDQVALDALAAAGLPADRLVIEITEGQLLGEEDLANRTLEKLRDQGVQLAIDDFGSGYSSLSYLRRMPVRAVKIDRTLLDGIGTDDRATTLVRAVIGVGRGMGLQVICEGIESLAVARLLRDLGAWAGQGFALYAALGPTALLDVLDGPPVSLADPPSGARRVVSHVETGRASD